MKQTLKECLIAAVVILGIALFVRAFFANGATFQGFQGGTGISTSTTSTVGEALTVASTSPTLTYTFTPLSAASVATTTINGAQCPAFTFSINATTVAASSFTVTTSSCNIFLNILRYTSSSDITVSTTGTILFASHNISQFINDVPFLTSSTGASYFYPSSSNPAGYISTSTNNFGGITNASVTANSPILWSSTSTISCPTCVVGSGTNAFAYWNGSGKLTTTSTPSGSGNPLTTGGTPSAFQGGGIPSSTTFSYTGATSSWTVPAGVFSITVNAQGAAGGTAGAGAGAVGKGGVATGTLAVTPGTTYYYCIGGVGGNASTSGSANPGVGGFCGGSSGGGAATNGEGGGGGGGMTWLATASTFSTSTAVIVGAGGGGASDGQAGGGGGGTTGVTGGTSGGAGAGGGVGGSQSSGGAGGTNANVAGSPGTGGAGGAGGAAAGSGSGGGGGGAGYYGGGGGGGGTTGNQGGGGGGGSSFVSTSLTATSTATSTHTGNGTMVINYNLPLNLSVQGTNYAGFITVSSTATSFSLTFNTSSVAFLNGESCGVETNNATNTSWISYNGTTSFTVFFQNSLTALQSFNYWCLGY